jgi:large conductance mechanosensitive channel
MSLISEFKQFAMKGNVVDLAVGVIIGAAFGKIVSSLVENVIMPPLGLALSGVNFADLAVTLGLDTAGKPVLLHYGIFLQSIFDFLIVAAVIFIAVKAINRLQAAPAAAEEPAAPAEPPRQEALLEEIRDLLKQTR